MLLKIEADGLFWHSPLRVCWVPHTDFSKAPGLLESLKRFGQWLRCAAGGWQTRVNHGTPAQTIEKCPIRIRASLQRSRNRRQITAAFRRCF
jgi:hypothetical protein